MDIVCYISIFILRISILDRRLLGTYIYIYYDHYSAIILAHYQSVPGIFLWFLL